MDNSKKKSPILYWQYTLPVIPIGSIVIIVRLAKADLDNIIDGDISTTHSVRRSEVPVDIKVKSLTDLKISLCENAESQPERY